jgi:hypothetical protein
MLRLTALLLALTACDDGKTDTDTTDTNDTTDTTGGTDTDGGDTDDTDLVPASDWTLRSHDCVGNRTDTLLIASDGTWWVGCGTTTNGTGLYWSDDEGQSWTQPVTDPPNYFLDFRAIDVWEDGGRIYASGDYTGGGSRGDDAVVSIDPTEATATIDVEFANGNQIWNSFLVGTYRQTSGGFAVAESNNGTGIVFRTGPSEPWQDGAGWRSPTLQLLDLEVHDDQFYGAGSTIADSPYVYLPPAGTTGPGADLQFTTVVLSDTYDGEMWDLHVDADGVFVGGVDQDGDIGRAYLSGSDPYDPSTWTEYRLDTWFPGESTWVEGVCRRGDTLAIVGRVANREDAIVLVSEDGGGAWEDVSPEAGSVYRCSVLEDGRLVVAGKDGLLGIWDPM